MTNPNRAEAGVATEVRAPRGTLKGIIEAVNAKGIKVRGEFYDYGRIFEGDRVQKDAIGATVEATVVQATRDEKYYIIAIVSLALAESGTPSEASAAETPQNKDSKQETPPTDDKSKEGTPTANESGSKETPPTPVKPGSDKQRTFALKLATEAKLTPEKVDLLLVTRFGQKLATATMVMMSCVIGLLRNVIPTPAAAEPASDKQQSYASDLVKTAGLSLEQVDRITLTRFGKMSDSLSKGEIMRLIPFLRGDAGDSGQRGRQGQRSQR